jgi:hypothetical protein
MKINPFEVVELFEKALAEYTGAPYVVTTTSCTEAIFLCMDSAYYSFDFKNNKVSSAHCGGGHWSKGQGMEKRYAATIPSQTYVSVPQSIIQAGFYPEFEEVEWEGIYEIKPYKVYDAAKRFRKNMYIPGTKMCLSFHHKKHLKIGKGGAILLDDKDEAEVLKRGRYEGREQRVPYHDDPINFMGYNMYMTPETAARGLTLLWDHPDDAADLIESPPYRDLRTFGFLKK